MWSNDDPIFNKPYSTSRVGLIRCDDMWHERVDVAIRDAFAVARRQG
jgi:hypothetical protein